MAAPTKRSELQEQTIQGAPFGQVVERVVNKADTLLQQYYEQHPTPSPQSSRRVAGQGVPVAK